MILPLFHYSLHFLVFPSTSPSANRANRTIFINSVLNKLYLNRHLLKYAISIQCQGYLLNFKVEELIFYLYLRIHNYRVWVRVLPSVIRSVAWCHFNTRIHKEWKDSIDPWPHSCHFLVLFVSYSIPFVLIGYTDYFEVHRNKNVE